MQYLSENVDSVVPRRTVQFPIQLYYNLSEVQIGLGDPIFCLI